MKPYYEHGGITIYHGDCREILPTLPAVDLVLTDPPYNAINRKTGGLRSIDKGSADSAQVDILSISKEFARVALGSIYVWCSGEQHTGWINAFKSMGMTTRSCAWWKSNPSPMNGDKMWLSAIELCVYARKEKAYFSRFCEPPVWKGPIDSESLGHPTPKPEWLMRRLIQASCPASGSVLDAYMGSGTTLLAAKEFGCRATGIELEERYCEIAAKRLSQEVMDFEATA